MKTLLISVFILPLLVTLSYSLNINDEYNRKINFNKFHPTESSEEIERDFNDIPVSKIGIDRAFDLLQKRLSRRASMRNRKGKNMNMVEKKTSTQSEICATSASLYCGEKILFILSPDDDIRTKCKAREEFLACVEEDRNLCKSLMAIGIFPTLPSEDKVNEGQERIYQTLWASGGCTLL